VTGFSRTRIHGLIADGTIESKKFGKRRILLAGGPRGLHALFAPSVSA
jgi:hypothetical protein